MVDARKQFAWIRSGLRGSLGDSWAHKESDLYERQMSPGRRLVPPG